MIFDYPEEAEALAVSVDDYFERSMPEVEIRAMDRARRVPREIWRKFAELGWMGLMVPEQYGGSDAGAVMASVLVEGIAKRFPSIAVDWVLVAMTARLFCEAGTAAQKAEYLTRLAAGDFLMSFGMTEPAGGTDILQLSTRAVQASEGWEITGQKLYTSLADDADAILVLARTDPTGETKRALGLSLLLTPRDQAGIEVRRLELMGMRAACTCEVFLDHAIAPEDGLVGERGRGWYHLLVSLDLERVLSAALSLGIAVGALEEGVRYAKEREAFGRPIGAHQAVQHPLADTATEIEQARLLIAKAATLIDAGRPAAKESAMAKLAATETAVRATDRVMRVFGGAGLVEASPIERLTRDARLGPFSPISNEMVRSFIGERLGLGRSY